jgi:hypothetical protein
MGAKGGHDPKDAPIVDGFNRVKQYADMTVQEKRMFNMHKAQTARTAKARMRKAEKEAIARGETPETTPTAKPETETDDDSTGSQMFSDMRAIYKKLKGRNKLEQWAKDDRNFMVLVKELMKMEATVLATRIRKGEQPDGSNGQQSFFVILKGLEDEKKFTEVEDKTVDMKQIKHVLEPEAGEYEEEKVEKVEGLADTPEGW